MSTTRQVAPNTAFTVPNNQRPSMQYYRPPALVLQHRMIVDKNGGCAYSPYSANYCPPQPQPVMTQSLHRYSSEGPDYLTGNKSFKFNVNAPPFVSSHHNLDLIAQQSTTRQYNATQPCFLLPPVMQNQQSQSNQKIYKQAGSNVNIKGPRRQFARKMRKSRVFCSESALNTAGVQARSQSVASLIANCDPTFMPLNNRMPETRTSQLRLQTYYTLVWGEDEKGKQQEPPEKYSDVDSDLDSSGPFAIDTRFHDIDTLTIDGDSTWSFDESDRSGGRRSGRETDEKELDSRTLNIQSKRFYVDVKQNWRGRYIKIAESMMGLPGGQHYNRRKSRIILSLPIAESLVKLLHKCESMGTKIEGSEKPKEDAMLYQEELKDSDRQYRCEYRENLRGRFLHIDMSTDAVTFGAARQVRPVINVPATGLSEMREELSTLLEKWDKDLPPDNSYKGPMPEQKSMRVSNKTYYFDYGQNQRGVFMRVSEVKPQWRTAITIPKAEWANFAQIFQEAAKIVDIKDLKPDIK